MIEKSTALLKLLAQGATFVVVDVLTEGVDVPLEKADSAHMITLRLSPNHRLAPHYQLTITNESISGLLYFDRVARYCVIPLVSIVSARCEVTGVSWIDYGHARFAGVVAAQETPRPGLRLIQGGKA